MGKRVLSLALLCILLAAGCVSTVRQQAAAPATVSGEESIAVRGLSREALVEARKQATDRCRAQNKKVNFLRSVFRKKTVFGMESISRELYYSCTTESVPSPLTAPPGKVEETIPETKKSPVPPKSDTEKETHQAAPAPPQPAEDKKPAASEAVAPKQEKPPQPVTKSPGEGKSPAKCANPPAPNSVLPSMGEPESLGPESLDPDENPFMPEQGEIIEEMLK